MALDRTPAPRLELEPNGEGWSVAAHGLPPVLSAASVGCLRSLLRVQVDRECEVCSEALPDIAGTCEVLGDSVRFIPDFPFDASISIRAMLDLGMLGQPETFGVLSKVFSFTSPAVSGEAKVSELFPSNAVLPENFLRFYVRFAGPMRRGNAESNIDVLGSDGIPVRDVLYRAPVELWDRSMTCLTILLDPGRLKRGVGPNRKLGPPLKAGNRYTLKVGPGMVDAHGRPLKDGFRHSFSVSEAIREPIAIEDWRVQPPTMGTRQPLVITFPRPLDWAQLWHEIVVTSQTSGLIIGRVDVGCGETRWSFTPETPWRADAYSVRVSPVLEDICGNTPYGPFDGPCRSADDMAGETATRAISFSVPS